jgi:hypothetical protein
MALGIAGNRNFVNFKSRSGVYKSRECWWVGGVVSVLKHGLGVFGLAIG